MSERAYWTATACRIAGPVLTHLADRSLRLRMPVEKKPGTQTERFSHLEAFARLLVGLSPWLELGEIASAPWAVLARRSLDAITDLSSPDAGPFAEQGQPLVEAAFLAQALLRAPNALWRPLDPRVKRNVLAALKATRRTKPPFNNWLLFSAMVEVALLVFSESDWDKTRVDYALRQHERWYLGDGVYGDGPSYHSDYYNAFVIHPMLIDIMSHVGDEGGWAELFPHVRERAIRYAAQLERTISPEGTFPPIGRSLAYRFGCLQPLAQMALQNQLPVGLRPAQVRCAMTAVIRRMVEAPGTFDENGWLRIGFCGVQPEVGENYISTGSLYLCSGAFLPLGLHDSAPFWSDPDESWTSVKAWGGKPFAIDKAISV
ncbi:MAG: DUF2264 domain-containing protein [Verrucomicrobiota bacterium]